MSISAVGGWLKRSMPTVLAVTALAVASDKPNSTAMLAGIVAAVLAVRWAREQGIADEARRGHTLLCRLLLDGGSVEVTVLDRREDQ